MPTSNHRFIDILLVEDSPTDVLLTQEALEASKLLNTLHVVEDGVEALDFLYKKERYSDKPRPGLILLDINLPRKNGLEVLKVIKEDADLHTIPVVILTTSKADEDIVKSYGFHANCYITKPVEFNKLKEVVLSLANYWFGIVTLPPAGTTDE